MGTLSEFNSDVESCSDSDDFRQDDYDSLYENDVSDQYFDETYEGEDYTDELCDVNQEAQADTSSEDGQGLQDGLFDEVTEDEDLSPDADGHDFNGIAFDEDSERLDAILGDFSDESWEGLSADDRRESIDDMAGYVTDVIGLENPPAIEYYNNPVEGDYGGYSPSTNTLSINEYMLGDGEEAADTVAHELWHAYQYEHANNPSSPKDYEYQYGFENYISADVDFEGYQDQLVESEARAFAEQFKGKLGK